ncbi:pectate lyase (eurofung) [Anaeramoeba ignava]|uniref:Pectate lyase (Eurofung) n=1 Tax=Anaeramoeba ignava TaxID=1746090 RepID=A0A9Q0R601_ANAIG|nr:pectate lyase (eurofung) [Anaeramoeba ignava]
MKQQFFLLIFSLLFILIHIQTYSFKNVQTLDFLTTTPDLGNWFKGESGLTITYTQNGAQIPFSGTATGGFQSYGYGPIPSAFLKIQVDFSGASFVTPTNSDWWSLVKNSFRILQITNSDWNPLAVLSVFLNTEGVLCGEIDYTNSSDLFVWTYDIFEMSSSLQVLDITVGITLDKSIVVLVGNTVVKTLPVPNIADVGDFIVFSAGNLLSQLGTTTGHLLVKKVYFDVNYVSDLYVNSNSGNDQNSGNYYNPLKTIQRAFLLCSPGTTIHVADGVYRETITPPFNGLSSDRITLKADGQNAAIVGSKSGSSYSWVASGHVELDPAVKKAYIPDLDYTPYFVSVVDEYFNVLNRGFIARTPNYESHEEYNFTGYWLEADGGSAMAPLNCFPTIYNTCDSSYLSSYTLTHTGQRDSNPVNLKTIQDLTGGTIYVTDATTGHSIYKRTIASHSTSTGQITVASSGNFSGACNYIGLYSRYYVENKLHLLDSPGEFYWDNSTHELYYWPPSSVSPDFGNVEISGFRNYGMELSGFSYITIEGLKFLFFDESGIRERGGDTSKSWGVNILNNKISYCEWGIFINRGTGTGIKINSNWLIEGNEIDHINAAALYIAYYPFMGASWVQPGVTDMVVKKNNFHHLGLFHDWSMTRSGVAFTTPNKLTFTDNTIHITSHHGLLFTYNGYDGSNNVRTTDIFVARNTISSSCVGEADCGCIKFWTDETVGVPHYFNNALVVNNTCLNSIGFTTQSQHREYWNGKGGFGYYLDNAGGVAFYRNIAFNNGYNGFSFFKKWQETKSYIYNNVVAHSQVGIYLGGFASTSMNETMIQNNVFMDLENNGIFYDCQTYSVDSLKLFLDHNLYHRYCRNNDWGNGIMYATSGKYFYNLSQLYEDSEFEYWEDHGFDSLDPGFTYPFYDNQDYILSPQSVPPGMIFTTPYELVDKGSSSLPSYISSLLTHFGFCDVEVGCCYDLGSYEEDPANTCYPKNVSSSNHLSFSFLIFIFLSFSFLIFNFSN